MRFLLKLSAVVLVFCLVGCSATEPVPDPKANVHYTMGLSYLREPNPTQALKEFLKAQAMDPENPEILNGLAQAYMLKRAYPQAESNFREALRLSGDEPQYHNNLAALYLEMERYDDAIEYFGKAASNLLFAEPEVAFVGMGYAYYLKRDYLAAVASYRKAIGYQPGYALAHFRLGEAYMALDKNPMAIESFREASRLAPNSPLVPYHLGLALVKTHDIPAARTAFKQVVRLSPDSEEGRQAQDYLRILK